MMRIEQRERKKTIVERLRSGESLVALAEEYDITIDYVDQIRALAGIERPRLNSCGSNVLRIIAALIAGEKKDSSIATDFHVTKQYIHAIRQRACAAGIPIKPTRKRRISNDLPMVEQDEAV